MQTGSHTAAALIVGAITLLAALPASAGDEAGWKREQIRQQKLSTLHQALGPRAADLDVDQPRIIGGEVAPAGKWPFQVALRYANSANNYDAQFCGGTLISNRHVLTAAHCVNGMRVSRLNIVTGTQSLTKGGTRRTVTAINVHPKYRARTSDYDIAVVTLTNTVSGIRPVGLLPRLRENAWASPGTTAYVLGWGDTKIGGGTSYPAALHQVQLPLVSRTVCNSALSYDGAVTNRMICAGLQAGGKDSCQGDSGGPLIVQNSRNRWRIQAGIVSWGEGCALRNLYGVYSRVAILGSWAKSIVNKSKVLAQLKSCDSLSSASQEVCLDQAMSSATEEIGGYLDQIGRGGTYAQRVAVDSEQRTWSRSLAGLCAFDSAAQGELGRKSCLLRETRTRAATLAGYLEAVD